LIDVINFNEKIASKTFIFGKIYSFYQDELLQKKDDLEQHKQQLALITDRIEVLNRDYNDRAAKCKGFKDVKFILESFSNFPTGF